MRHRQIITAIALLAVATLAPLFQAGAQITDNDLRCTEWYRQNIDGRAEWPLDPVSFCPLLPPKECFANQKPTSDTCPSPAGYACPPPVIAVYDAAYEVFANRVLSMAILGYRTSHDPTPVFARVDGSLLAKIAKLKSEGSLGQMYPDREKWHASVMDRLNFECPRDGADRLTRGYVSLFDKRGIDDLNIQQNLPNVTLSSTAFSLLGSYANRGTNNRKANATDFAGLLSTVHKESDLFSFTFSRESYRRLVAKSMSMTSGVRRRELVRDDLWASLLNVLGVPERNAIDVDVNNDGLRDKIVVQPERNSILVYFQLKNTKTGKYFYSRPDEYPLNGQTKIQAGDINNDGAIDILTTGGVLWGGFRYYRNLGASRPGKFVYSVMGDGDIIVNPRDREGRDMTACLRKRSNNAVICAATDAMDTGIPASYASPGTFGSFARTPSGAVDFQFNENMPGESYELTVLTKQPYSGDPVGFDIRFQRGGLDEAYVSAGLRGSSSNSRCCFKKLSPALGHWDVHCVYPGYEGEPSGCGE